MSDINYLGSPFDLNNPSQFNMTAGLGNAKGQRIPQTSPSQVQQGQQAHQSRLNTIDMLQRDNDSRKPSFHTLGDSPIGFNQAPSAPSYGRNMSDYRRGMLENSRLGVQSKANQSDLGRNIAQQRLGMAQSSDAKSTNIRNQFDNARRSLGY